jgi:3-hydroxyisobutyrate dehydrogenase-like beta-hydroxyacid dehydrogenase
MAEGRPRIGFIGLGMMGRGMAKNLLAKGFPLTSMAHRRRDALEALLAAGASEAKTVAGVVGAADVVILCVTGSPEVEAVIEGGLLDAARGGLIVVDCSTSEPATTERLAERLATSGARLADAPLARTPREAEEGRLNTMVGADDETFATIRPVLEAFSENIVHCGPVGSGHKMKLLYNFMSQGLAVMIAEALAACAATGIDPRKYFDVVSAGGANSGMFQMIVPKALEGDLSGVQFSIDNSRKDLRYYTAMLAKLGVPSLMGDAAHESLALASAMGLGDKFVPSLIEAQEKLSGARILGPA